MPAINLTNNTDLNLNATAAGDNATLNRYLKDVLTFKTPPSFDAIANILVKDQSERSYPVTLSAAVQGDFALEKTTVEVSVGAAAQIGLLQHADEESFLSGLQVDGNPASSGLVSFGITGTLTVGDEATAGDFTFGVSKTAAVTLTSYYNAGENETIGSAVEKAVAGLTIPHDIQDLRSIPSGAICALDASGSLQFTAGITCTFLNDPLAAASIANLPSLGITAAAAATIEATVTHNSDHTLTIARLPGGPLHLSVSLTRTDDFATSLTVSSGVAANIGTQDSLSFLLGRINPDSQAQADAIAGEMTDAQQFRADIKQAIDTSLSASLAVSLTAALDRSTAKNRAFLYEIDLDKLDDASQAALQAALTGDFTKLTKPGAQLAGIKELDSALTVTNTTTHTLALHLLGIFNFASVNEFMVKSVIDYTKDTHEIVLADKSIEVTVNNLDAEKLRKLALKEITLTLPAAANTPEAKTPLTLAFFDREASTKPSRMQQFANALSTVGAADSAAAQSLLARNLGNYGACSICLGLSLTPPECKQLFLADGNPHDFAFYIQQFCAAESAILAGLDLDPETGFRLRLFHASLDTWNDLHDKGAAAAMLPILKSLGLNDTQAQFSVTDAITGIWWADAMAKFAKALAHSQSLVKVGSEVVKDANQGYTEPWLALAAWNMAGKPEMKAAFHTSIAATPALAAGR